MRRGQMNRRITAAFTVFCTTLTATVAFAGAAPGTGINGSMHDLNQGIYTHDKFQRTCAFCHTPHNALNTSGTTGGTPLWNHKDTGLSLATVQPYTWLAPANARADVAWSKNNDPLTGPSRLCMACHDGNTAADAHGGAGTSTTDAPHQLTTSNPDGLGNTAYRSWSNLKGTHPIGFKYDEAATGRGASEIVDSGNGFLTADLQVGGNAAAFNTQPGQRPTGQSNKKIKDTLYDGYMTCATCHDVHNTVNVGTWVANGGGNDYNYFLYAKEEGSAICLSCHIK